MKRNEKELAVCGTKTEKIEFNYVEPGYMELAYISSDWKVWKNVRLQNLCVNIAAETLEVPFDDISKAFYWAEDKPTHHKHLFVKMDMIEKSYLEGSFIKDYMHGFVDAVGYM